ALAPEARKALDRIVNVSLPVIPPDALHLAFNRELIPLAQAYAALTAQLGVTIEFSEDIAELPVNPCVMRGVRLRTAMDLLIRQWPYPQFGYEVHPDRILIRSIPAARPAQS